jgi:heterodisulfide reductase subunit B
MTEISEQDKDSMTISSALAERIQDELGENVYLCYQCVKCTSGCPIAEYFDWQPNQVMRALQLGQEDIALESQTPWLCAACQTCSTRCPQGLDIASIMDFLTREALDRDIEPAVPQVDDLNKAFMREVKLWGRAYEPGMMAERFIRRPKDMFADVDLYIKMLRKRKVKFLPSVGRPAKNVKPIPDAVNAVAYYPGCSLHSTAKEFNTSTKAVCEAIGLKLIEPKGWVCCGSSAAHRSDPESATMLPMTNLAMIEQSGFTEVTMPCAACYNRHKSAQFELGHDEQHKEEIDEKIGYDYQDSVYVSTISEAILNHVGTEDVSEKVKKPLEGLRVVCYYGCLMTRPPEITGSEHPDNPTDMDQLMEALGAEVLDWSYKTSCCGAAHTLTKPEIVINLSGGLVNHASDAGAEAMVVACPLCHANLDARQFQMDVDEPMPVLYFTQLMALAMGLSDKEAALDKNMTDPRPLLREKGLLQS